MTAELIDESSGAVVIISPPERCLLVALRFTQIAHAKSSCLRPTQRDLDQSGVPGVSDQGRALTWRPFEWPPTTLIVSDGATGIRSCAWQPPIPTLGVH